MTAIAEHLYGLRALDLTTVYASSVGHVPYGFDLHADCTIGQFCRNPLHPGPCKGWKRRLGLVAPGALHALERARAEKLEERRKAKVAALLKAGHRVPARLAKPITYDPATSQHLKPHADTGLEQKIQSDLKGAKQVVANVPTSDKIGAGIAARQPAGHAPIDVTDVKKGDHVSAVGIDQYGKKTKIEGYVTGVGDVTMKDHSPGAKPGARVPAKALQMSDTPTGQGAHFNGVVYVKADQKVDKTPPKTPPAPSPSAPAAPAAAIPDAVQKMTDQQLVNGITMRGTGNATGQAMSAELRKRGLDSRGNQLPIGPGGKVVTPQTRAANAPSSTPSTKAPSSANAPSAPAKTATPSAGPTPAAPLPSGTSAHVQHASAVANRSAPGARVAKTQVAAYDKLDKADFDKLPDSTRAQIRSDLRTAKAKFLDPKKQAQVDAVLAKLNGPPGKPQDNGPSPATPKAPEPPKAPPAGVATPSTPSSTPSPAPTSAPTTPAAPVTKAHAHQQLIDDVHAADDHDVADRLVALRKAVGKDDPAYTKARDKVIDDTKRPLWLRSSLVPSRAGTDQRVASALAVAEHPPARGNGKLYITHYDAGDIFQPSDKDIAHLHPVQKEAIYHRRNEAIDVLTSGNVHDVSNDLAVAQGFNSTRDPQSGIFPIDKQKVSHLSPKARTGLEGALQRVAVERSGMLDVNQKSGFQSTLEDLQNVTHPPKVATALRVNRLRPYNDLDILDAGDDVTEADYKALPAAHQNMLLGNMTRVMRGGNTATIKRDARHRQMRWLGTYPKYSAASTNESVLAAGLDRTDLSPDDRLNQHLRSGVAGYNMLNGYDASLVKADIQGIADGNGTNTAGLQLNQRFDAQKLLDRIDSPRRGSQERDAISVAEPGFHDGKSVQARAQIYNALNAREFNALPKAYRDSILDDLENNVAHANLPVTGMADNLRARFDPKFAAQLKAANAAPTNPAIVPNMIGANQSDLKDALDVVYGLHPKAQHTSHQLATYGKLRKGQFDLLKPHEQQTILADLSFIETTSTRPSTKSKAKTLIHNFTPAGTAVGTTPPQAILPPATAVQGQTRVADPLGTPGTLKKSTNPGTGGDGWFRSPGGKTVWGKYGAAGLLLRHRGDDGVDRYLMVERGPAISDPGKWQFPGGAIDSKETFHEGAAREVIEELGFKDTDLIASRVHGEHTASVPGGWSYVSIAATTPTQLKPDLSTHHARAETSDAKWMTVDEIRKLDKNGKLLAPLANGALEKNVLSLFPASAPKATVARPGPVTKRAARLTGTPTVPVAPKPASPHKPSLGKDLVSDATTRDKLRQDVKAARVRFAGKTADDRLAAIGEIQGYDDTPSVVDKSTFDQLLATGNYIEAWRGVKGRGAAPRRGLGGAVSNTKTAEEINEEMRSGPAYYGKGVYGNGYYLAVSKSVAKGYSDGTKNSLVRVLIPKTAKIIKINDVQNQRSTHGINSRSKAKGSGGWDESTLWNEGRMAAALGKDGIQIDYSTGASHIAPTRSQPAFNWVNRGVLIVQEAE